MGTRVTDDETVINLGTNDESLPQKSDSLEHKAADDWLAFQGDTDIKLSVYQETPGKRTMDFMFAFYPSDYDQDSLQQFLKGKYGGGNYRVQARSGGKLKLNMPISVANEPKEQNESTSKLESMIANMSNSNNDNMPMITLMMQMQNDSAQRQADSQRDSQNQMMTMLTAILPALTQKPEAQQAPDMLSMLSTLKELMPQQGNPMENFIEGIKLAGEMSTGGDNGAEPSELGIFNNMVSTFGPALVDQVSKATENKPALGSPAAPTPPTQEEMQRKQQEMMLGHVNQLLGFAKNNTDPYSVYDIMDSMLNEQQWLNITTFLGMDEWFQKISLLQPEVAQYDQWFITLRDIIINPDDGEEEIPENELTLAPEPDINTLESVEKDIQLDEGNVEKDATAGTPNTIPLD